VPIPYPPPCEQQRIADYLDERCAAIDEVGHTIEDEIEALRRLRKATIHRAVTKGLDEGVPMRDSGYHYIGNICKDWQLVRFRYLCDIDTGDHDTQDKEPDGEYPMYVRSPNVERSNTYTFDCEGILMAGDGAELQIGQPYVDTKVFGEVIENGKAKKVIIFKYKAKKDYRKKQGHRQPYTMIEITGIGTDNGRKAPVAETVETEKKTASMSMKKDELIAFAAENGIEVDAKATKQVILDTINENLK
jgi:ribosomal protein L21